MTASGIDYKIKSAFVATAYLNGDMGKLDGWRLLIRISQGQGDRQLLRPLQGGVGGSLEYHDLYM